MKNLNIETIFEHNVTAQELYNLFGCKDMTKERYLGIIQRHANIKEEIQEKAYITLYHLYYWRGDVKKATEYAKKIPNRDWKYFTMLNHDIQ